MSKLIYDLDYYYTDRASKLEWVFDKYKNILKGRVLDVGADEMHLKKFLPPGTEYIGTGLGDFSGQIKVDLEKDKLPFEPNSFDIVMCLDVLEHIETIHKVFDDICTISKQWVLISLPNPWQSLMSCLQNGPYKPGRNTKFYGLPLEREQDRHKWFFSASEAREFIDYNAKKNSYEIFDLFVQSNGSDGIDSNLSAAEKNKIHEARQLLFRANLNFSDLYEGTLWWVLKKK